MLKEEQATELLRRCETAVRHSLPGIRARLRIPARAAALWELLVIEAASALGDVEYEPSLPEGGSPDVRLLPPGARPLWIEAAYLYPKFWKEERQSDEVSSWLAAEADRRGIAPWKIERRFDGDRGNEAGPVRKLPYQHQRKEFLRRPEIIAFFEAILAHPDEPRACAVPGYTVSFCYSPYAEGPFSYTSGLVQDAPKSVRRHHVYKVLNDKAQQHRVGGPRAVVLGSDQIPGLLSRRSPAGPSLQDVVEAVFSKHGSLSAVIVFSIEGVDRKGTGQLFLNPKAREPLTDGEAELLRSMNLNRWKYTFPLARWEQPVREERRRVAGEVRWQIGDRFMEIEVPASLVVDALAGKTSLPEALDLSADDALVKRLRDGWVIETCTIEEGNLEAGEDRKVVLRLGPRPERVFWPEKTPEDAGE